MVLTGHETCKKIIKNFVTPSGEKLARLKELLPLIFDSQRIFTMEAQKKILMECSLIPVREYRPFHCVTFRLEPELSTFCPNQNPGPEMNDAPPSSSRRRTAPR